MRQVPQSRFEASIGRCRSKYHLFRQLASRTRNALYVALGEGYDLFLEMPGNDALRAEFEQALSSQNMRRSDRESLLFIEYAYFPHVLLPGKDHKTDIDKASTYANVFDKAAATNITSAEFVPWVRKNGGIHNIAYPETARVSRRAKRPPLGKSARVESQRTSGPAATSGASTVVEQPELGPTGLPGDLWYCNAAVAEKAAKARQAVKDRPQKVTRIFYAYGETEVLIGVTTTPGGAPPPYAGHRIRA